MAIFQSVAIYICLMWKHYYNLYLLGWNIAAIYICLNIDTIYICLCENIDTIYTC